MSYPLCWLPDGAAPVLCPALPLPGLPLAYPFLGCLPPKTHHGSAGCPSASSALGSLASFPGALALSSWARAPSSRARCRHDLSSERVTFEEIWRHRTLSASQLPYIPLPALGPASSPCPSGVPVWAADLRGQPSLSSCLERHALGSQGQGPGRKGPRGEPMTRPYGVLAAQKEGACCPQSSLSEAPLLRGAWHLPGARLWLPPGHQAPRLPHSKFLPAPQCKSSPSGGHGTPAWQLGLSSCNASRPVSPPRP